jgi:2-aminoadipate transaminase
MTHFAKRMNNVPKSFIREILKTTVDPEIISFAGGLPNPAFFPVKEFSDAAQKVMLNDGHAALQYSTTEGYAPLRQYIADRYLARQGMRVNPDDILITTGSQQGLDLLGKIFIEPGDDILIERPGYLGAIQALSIFEPTFHPINLHDDGIDLTELEATIAKVQLKFFYGVPSFQNPSGLTYSREKRRRVAEIMDENEVILVEDDPYGELRFIGEDLPPIRQQMRGEGVLLGSFSKIVAPGLRLGWIWAPAPMMDKLVTAKQACDLHTNFFSQRVLYQFLIDNDVDAHIERIRRGYRGQRDAMVQAIDDFFPPQVTTTRPEGGMFLWSTLPSGVSSVRLFELALQRKVAFVPGNPFYTDLAGQDANTMRINYSCCDEDVIREGIRRLAEAMGELF